MYSTIEHMRLAMVIIAASTLLSHTILLPHAFAKTVTVVMSEEGFLPREVTVEQNDTITFVNNDKVSRWPASNLHPTHSIYSQFDPKRPIRPNESWSFRPDRPGTWKYHDHLLPHKKGVLIVLAEKGEKKTTRVSLMQFIKTFFANIMAVFHKEETREVKNRSIRDFLRLSQAEQINILDKKMESEGVESVWKFVVSLYSGKGELRNAHDLAHFVGGKIYENKGLLGLSICSPSFAFGCYHGFTESAFTKGLGDLYAIEKGCESVGKVHSGPWASCIHGIGHGIATYFDTSDLPSALLTCDRLSNGQTYCFDGVFMEFATNAPKSVYGTALTPLYPCTSLEEKYKQACARQQPIVMSKLFGMDLKTIASVCAKAERTIQFYCIDAIGLTVGQRSSGDPNRITEECNHISQLSDRVQCVSAAAGEVVFQKYDGWETKSFAACATLPTSLQPSCQKRVEEVIASYPR